MSRRQDTRTPRQRFTALVQAELDLRMQEHEWSVSRFIRESRVSRPTMYDWLNPDSERMPSLKLVQRYTENLQIPYEPYAEALGWTEFDAAPPRDLDGFIERAKRIAAHPKTSERRRQVLESQIEAAETAQRASRALLEPFENLLRESVAEAEERPDR
jgi:hypothetical protein